MKKKELLLVRHGETQWNTLELIQGHLDSPLTGNGRKSAEKLAHHLSHRGVDVIYASDLGRAMETAQIIGCRCAKPVISNPGLRERCYGEMQGCNWSAIEEHHPEVFRGLRSTDFDYTPPGGESRNAFQERISSAILKVLDSHESGTVLAVTHGGVISAFVRHVLGLPLEAPRRYSLRNLAINRFIVKRGVIFLETLGETVHLEEGEE